MSAPRLATGSPGSEPVPLPDPRTATRRGWLMCEEGRCLSQPNFSQAVLPTATRSCATALGLPWRERAGRAVRAAVASCMFNDEVCSPENLQQ